MFKTWIHSLVVVAASVLPIGLWGTYAHAQDAQAEALNAEGKKLVKQLDLEGAAERFREAMRIAPDRRYAFNLCYTLEKIREYEEARSACAKVEGAKDTRLADKAAKLLIVIDQKLAEQRAKKSPPDPIQPPVGQPPATQPPVGQPPATRPPVTQPAVMPSSGQPQYGQTLYLPQKRTHTYRLQVVLADAASWTLLLIGAGSESGELSGLGFAGLALAGPTIHLIQDNSSSAYLSLGARLGMPLGGALLLSADCNDFDCFGQAAAGAVLGYMGALALDWFVLAKRTEYYYPQNRPLVQPTVSLSDGGAMAGLQFNL